MSRKKWTLLVTLLALPSLFLALELFTALNNLYVQRFNEYYLYAHNSPHSSPWHPREDLRPTFQKAPDPPDWADWPAQQPQAPDYELPVPDETPQSKAARQAAFIQLGEEDRQWYSLGSGETVFKFSPDSRLLHIYDHAYLAVLRLAADDLQPIPGQEIRAGVAKALEKGAAITTSFWTMPPYVPHQWELAFAPAPDRSAVFLFASWKAMRLDLDLSDHPNSRFEVYQFRYKPSSEGPFDNVTGYQTNRYGFRSAEVTVPKPDGTFRVLCLGGSTTVEGATNESTYPAYLEQMLRDAFPGKHIEVMNCGVEGISTSDNLLHLPDYIGLQPDLVIAYEGINDIGTWLRFIYDLKMSLPCRVLSRSRFLRLHAQRLFWPSPGEIRQEIRAFTMNNIEEMRRVLARKGIHLAVCSIPHPHLPLPKNVLMYYNTTYNGLSLPDAFCKNSDMLNDELRRFCHDKHVLYVPLFESIASINPIDYFVDQCHVWPRRNVDLNKLKAEAIFTGIKDYIAPAMK